MSRPVADVVAGFKFDDIELDDDDLPVGALVLVKAVDSNGVVSVASMSSDGLDWLSRLGMVTFIGARLAELDR